MWHFFVGGGLVLLGHAAGIRGPARMVAPIVAGAAKEAYDARFHGPMREHVLDFTATVLGGLAVYVAMDTTQVPVVNLKRWYTKP
jgi:hypothetical protein